MPGPGDRPIPLPIERIYSSPYYRCLQTIQPFVQAVSKNDEPELDNGDHDRGYEQVLPPWWAVRCDPGLVDWFGPAPFEQPKPASLKLLRDSFFPWIDLNYAHSGIVPRRHGESMAQLHGRVAATLIHIIRQCDAEGVRAIVLCTHAASIIAMGRVLTGQLPEDVAARDFDTFTCGLSTFRRRQASSCSRPHQSYSEQGSQQCSDRSTPGSSHQQKNAEKTCATPSVLSLNRFYAHVPPWDDQFQTLAGEAWIGGRGVEGGWDCEENSDCSFLSKGEERGWWVPFPILFTRRSICPVLFTYTAFCSRLVFCIIAHKRWMLSSCAQLQICSALVTPDLSFCYLHPLFQSRSVGAVLIPKWVILKEKSVGVNHLVVRETRDIG